MTGNEFDDILGGNIGRMLRSARADALPVDDLVGAVLAQVRAEKTRRQRARIVRLGWGLAAAASVVVGVCLWRMLVGADSGTVGQVRPVYGLVSTELGSVGNSATIRRGQRIQTHTGSRAEIVLADKSRLLIEPRSAVRVDRGRLVLEQGGMSLDVVRQAAGRPLEIASPGALVRVLGTRLDVHVIQKSDGRKQTRVSVETGKVEMESGPRIVFLPAGTEGIAEEGRALVRRALVPEVNEMIRLREWNVKLARERKVSQGVPCIVDFNGDGTATVWTVVKAREASRYDRIYTLAGSIAGPEDLAVAETEVIVQTRNVRGLFDAKGRGMYEVDRAASSPASLSLVQFRLPGSARIDAVSPEPIETRRTLSRLVVTVPAEAGLSEVLRE